jgi:hypothetical protein
MEEQSLSHVRAAAAALIQESPAAACVITETRTFPGLLPAWLLFGSGASHIPLRYDLLVFPKIACSLPAHALGGASARAYSPDDDFWELVA